MYRLHSQMAAGELKGHLTPTNSGWPASSTPHLSLGFGSLAAHGGEDMFDCNTTSDEPSGDCQYQIAANINPIRISS